MLKILNISGEFGETRLRKYRSQPGNSAIEISFTRVYFFLFLLDSPDFLW